MLKFISRKIRSNKSDKELTSRGKNQTVKKPKSKNIWNYCLMYDILLQI